MKTAYASLLSLLLLAAAFLPGCKKDDDSPNTPGSANVSLRLTDGPGNYDAVWIDIRQVEIITDAGRTTLVPFRPGRYDLLSLSNGIDTLLLTAPIPAATISQIRLILGPDNSVVVGGVSHPLNTPSAQESGLKLNLHETLVAGQSYTFWLDFDAGRSIVKTGNGKYQLKPVIRAYTAATNGQIEGYVFPPAAGVMVYATFGSETYAAIPSATGYYRFTGLPAGSYGVLLDATLGSYTDVRFDNVNVNFGAVTTLAPTTLTP